MKKQFVTTATLSQITAQLIEVTDSYIADNVMPNVTPYDMGIMDILDDLSVPQEGDDDNNYKLFQLMRLALVLHYSLTSPQINEILLAHYNDIRFRDRNNKTQTLCPD